MDSPNVKDLIISSGFKFNKALGQNFVTDKNLLNAIVDDALVTYDDTVVEIGTGAGTLTRAIAEKAKQVISFEVDKNLAPVLDLSLKGLENVTVVFKDVLKMKKEEFEKIVSTPFKVVANLPYYVTTPMIMHFLESDLPVISVTVMVQKEVAMRMQAGPGTKDYGALSLAVQFYAEPYIAANVPPNCFIPRPNVGSAVIRLKTYEQPQIQVKDEAFLFALIRASFNQRRKTLVNSLKNASDLKLEKEQVLEALRTMGLSETVRGEALTLEQFASLADLLKA